MIADRWNLAMPRKNEASNQYHRAAVGLVRGSHLGRKSDGHGLQPGLPGLSAQRVIGPPFMAGDGSGKRWERQKSRTENTRETGVRDGRHTLPAINGGPNTRCAGQAR